MYDGTSLAALFREAGFYEVSIRDCLESAIRASAKWNIRAGC